MADIMDEDLKKMKVPDLRQALKDKGLPTSGTKPELIKRLLGSVGSPVDGGDSALDDDEILKDDPAPPAAAGPPKSPEKLPTKANNDTNGVQESTESNPEIQMPADTTDNLAKPVEVQKLSDAERLKLRAEKFGITSEQAKKDLRAQRFGLPENKSGNIDSSNISVDADKLKKRAERFGIPVTSQTSEDERKRKRAERFGTSSNTPAKSTISLNSTDSELEAKKRKRAERFGLT